METLTIDSHLRVADLKVLFEQELGLRISLADLAGGQVEEGETLGVLREKNVKIETLSSLTIRYNKTRNRDLTELQTLELVVRVPQLVVMVADGKIDNHEKERIARFATDLYDGIFYMETEEDKQHVIDMIGTSDRDTLMKAFSEELAYLSENLREWEGPFLSALRSHIESGANPLVRRSQILRKMAEAAFTSDMDFSTEPSDDSANEHFLQSTLEAIRTVGVITLESKILSPNTSPIEKTAIIDVSHKIGAKPFDSVPIFGSIYLRHIILAGLNVYKVQYVETYEWIASRRKSSYDGTLTVAGYRLKLTNASARAFIESTMRQNIGDLYSVKILSVVPLNA